MPDDVNANLGISRRQLIKRGAIVGGTVMWAAPVVQSLTSPAGAVAQGRVGTPSHACCFCYDGSNAAAATNSECSANGLSGPRSTAAKCEEFCDGGGLDQPGTPYQNFIYDRGTVGCQCNNNLAFGPTGCNCT